MDLMYGILVHQFSSDSGVRVNTFFKEIMHIYLTIKKNQQCIISLVVPNGKPKNIKKIYSATPGPYIFL